MKNFVIFILVLGLLSCKHFEQKKVHMENETIDLESLAFDGINIDFQFNQNKPTFGDLFLIVGFANPNYPPDTKEFEKLSKLGFEQVGDYFGLKNNSSSGDDVVIWLYPIKDGKEVTNNSGPFDAIRISYVIIRNDQKTKNDFRKVYNTIKSILNVTPIYNGDQIDDFDQIGLLIDQIIKYCKQELKVIPGSDKALKIEW